MALMRWEPFSEMEQMRRQMDTLLGRMLGGRGEHGTTFMPSVEVYTKENEVVIKAEIPGIEPEQIEVEVMEDAVRLSGELKRESEIEEDNYYRSERQYGHFERLVPLPNRIQEGQAKASFKNGVLTVRAPLAEEERKQKAHKLNIEKE